ncbi:leucine-rich_repeat domain-containing protein [Hexamita inflata]|uniref:Leucine-rich repeat domain-containing protein n=1 Tax=Hexamita inflata TaxID=28002 RepID=A0AA86RKE3_9EUKA|nr:leucine-rich repeat domain-containing protein [Hexamita inflata]
MSESSEFKESLDLDIYEETNEEEQQPDSSEQDEENYIEYEYEPDYNLKDTYMVFVNNDPRMKTFVFVDKVIEEYNDGNIPFLKILKCPNVSFRRVPYSIRELKINECSLKNIKGISQMSLFELDLSENNISDISELRKFDNNLSILDLSFNHIVDISPLGLNPETKQLPFKLEILELRNNDIINIDALKDQKDITELYLANNNIEDFTPFQNNLKKKNSQFRNYNHSAKNHAYQYKIDVYDDQYELNDEQLYYQKKYLAYMNSKNKCIFMSQRLKQIQKTNYQASALKALETVQRNFSNFLSYAVMLKSTECYGDQ